MQSFLLQLSRYFIFLKALRINVNVDHTQFINYLQIIYYSPTQTWRFSYETTRMIIFRVGGVAKEEMVFVLNIQNADFREENQIHQINQSFYKKFKKSWSWWVRGKNRLQYMWIRWIIFYKKLGVPFPVWENLVQGL